MQQEIVRSDGTATILRAQASFDGKQYPVEGSPIVDNCLQKDRSAYDYGNFHDTREYLPVGNNYGES